MVPPAIDPVEGEGAPPRQIVTVQTRSCTCLVDAEVRSALGELLRADDPDLWPPMREVKSSRVRRILRGDLHGPDGQSVGVHVKLFRAVRLSDRARDAIVGSRAVAEFHNLLEARARGLPAVRPLAAGSFRGSYGSRSFLVTETIENVEALPPGPLPAPVARNVGDLLRRAHDRGLHAQDLHPGNLIGDARGRVWLLDLTSASFADTLEPRERARALAFFCQGLDGGAGDPSAAPLTEAYGASEELVVDAAGLGRRLRRRALSAFGRRATRSCRHTLVEPGARGRPSWFLHQPAAELHGEARRMVDQMDRLTPQKAGRRGAVWVRERLVMKSRSAAAARHLFRAAYWLTFAGVPCPQPVGLRTHQGLGTVLVRRLPWPTVAEELRSATLRGTDLRAAARSLGDAVGRLHAHGLRNRDLKLENLIRDPADNRVYMVDLDGVRRKKTLDRRGQGADLGRLLAGFRAAAIPGDTRAIGAFLHGYNPARKCLFVPRSKKSDRHLWRLSAARASAWASAHSPRAESSGAS